MSASAGMRGRAIAGLVCAALLAALAVTNDGADFADAPGANETVASDDEGLPQAFDEDGEVIPAEVGAPPELDIESIDKNLIERDRQELAAGETETTKVSKEAAAEAPQADPGTMLVVFKPGTADDKIAAALAGADVAGERLADSNTYVVKTAGVDEAKVTEALSGNDSVATVEPNRIRSAAKVPNDPQTATQTSYLNGLGIQAAWDAANTGSNVVVAVVDSGVDLDHPDLAPNLVPGYNAINPSASVQDDNGHGTAVAGVIGAATNNGSGVAGVAWNAKIMPIKVLDAQGRGTDVDIAEGIRWAADHGADVINLSLGGPGRSATIEEAVYDALGLDWEGNYVGPNDAVVIAAAGNDASSYVNYPAAAPGVIAVSATDHDGRYAWFSNHGAWIDIAAPGIDITSTALAPGATNAVGSETGTSLSSPIVAGVAALVRERHPSWRWDRVQWELLRTASDKGVAGSDDAYGFGIVNAAAAMGVGSAGAVSQPNLSGDAGNVPGGARAITVGTPASESLAYETDEDWFSVSLPSAGTATVTVTPPPILADGVRAGEIDPVVAVYGPGGGLVAQADDVYEGEAENLSFFAGAATYRIRVRNWLASAGPAPYTITVQRPAVAPVTELAAPAAVNGLRAIWTVPAIADVTDDGRNDMVVGATHIDNTRQGVWLLEGLEGDTYAPPVLLAVLSFRSVAAADLDGDGDTDIAISADNGLGVVWNTPTGLEPVVTFPSITASYLVDAVQFDAMPGVELIDKPMLDTGPVRVVRWTGTTFTSAPLGLGSSLGFDADRSYNYAAGDLNGDGLVDIATDGYHPGWGHNAVGIFLQKPGGGWTAQHVIPGGIDDITWRDIEIGDLTNDGRDDLAMVGWSSISYDLPHLLVVQAQNDDGTMADATYLPMQSEPRQLFIEDLTGDDRNDLVMSHEGSIGVRAQTPSGRPSAYERLIPNAEGTVAAIGQLAGDDLADVVLGNESLRVRAQQVATAATPEGPKVGIESSSPVANATGVSATGNVTVTFGDVDPAWVSYGPGIRDTVLITDARGNWFVEAAASLSGRTLTINPNQSLQAGVPYRVWVNGVKDTAGNPIYQTFSFTTAAAAPPARNVNAGYYPFPVDIDGNGYDDVVWYTPSTALDPVWAFYPDGKFDFGKFDIRGTFKPVAGDFDGNGYEDIFWYAPGSALDTMWYVGVDPTGTLQITPVNYTVNATYTPYAGDYDGNGYDDILFYASGTGPEVLWKFKAGRSFTGSKSIKMDGTDMRVAVGDYNRDGLDDVFWHKPGTGAEYLWKGGPTAFTSSTSGKLNANYNVRGGDYNGDGFDDIFFYATNVGFLWKGGATFTQQGAPVIPSTSRPVVGDFTGDLREDIIAYVPGTTADKLLVGKPTGL